MTDLQAWKQIVDLVISYEDTIGHAKVAKLLLLIVQKAFSIDWELPQYKKLVSDLLANKKFDEIPEKKRAVIIKLLATSQLIEATELGMLYNNRKSRKFLYQTQVDLAILEKITILLNDSGTPNLLQRYDGNYTLVETEEEIKHERTIVSSHDVFDDLLRTYGDFYLSPDINQYSWIKRYYTDYYRENGAKSWAKRNESYTIWRTSHIEVLRISFTQRIALEASRDLIIEENSWIKERHQEVTSLPLKQCLAIAKAIVEVSGGVHMPYNREWADRGIVEIGDRLAQVLKNSVLKHEGSLPVESHKETFLHSAACRGEEATDIIEAIANTSELQTLLEACCHAGEKSPLEIALKANNQTLVEVSKRVKSIITLLSEHTHELSIWLNFLKKQYRSLCHSVTEVKTLIEKDYSTVKAVEYRLLNTKYCYAEQIVWRIVKQDIAGQHVLNMLRGETWMPCLSFMEIEERQVISSNIIKDVIADHPYYFLYLLRYTKTHNDQKISPNFSVFDYLSRIYIENPFKATTHTLKDVSSYILDVLKSNISSHIKAYLIDEDSWDALSASQDYPMGSLFYLYVHKDHAVEDFKDASNFTALLKKYQKLCENHLGSDCSEIMTVMIRNLVTREKTQGASSLVEMAARQAIVKLREENPIQTATLSLPLR